MISRFESIKQFLSNSTPMGQTQFCTCLVPLKQDITTLGDMVISSILVSTHVVKSLTIRQPSSNWAELDKLWEGWTAHDMTWFKKVIC